MRARPSKRYKTYSDPQSIAAPFKDGKLFIFAHILSYAIRQLTRNWDEHQY
ncbi:uncharacterized protein MELLADRAFT_95270 [Melampsora larici-populina 98AG31]|uniref:Uncharacterized protein n=1 Tax=Melampsora larici-populina (strain 98AG31 / pathotype 3-4-7) TaxID=747676 RepID=F4RCU7_MELLP|nr:uncharacterized protein MELLADRAFT_95270 [Melampsora larici-populina 98AG31]EGG09783.1 hypothetical protein MELLADRAFT_95270 [Melampsora larici-populina 98AG31]